MDFRFVVVFASLPEERKAAWRAAIETLAGWLVEDETPFPAFPQIREHDLGEGESAEGESKAE